jgi:hypothetical protein
VRHQGSTVEQVIGELASVSYGVVTRVRLLRAGITPAEIRWRLRIGALLREHRGVYRVGHRAPSFEARYLAAVWACGAAAALTGPAAGYLLGLVKRGSPPPPEVTAPTHLRVEGVRTRRSAIPPGDRTIDRGIPVTTVPRTLVDLAADLCLDDLARACHEAGIRYGTTPAHLAAVLARRRNTPGAPKLRAILHGDARVTLSALERRFLELLRDAGLALPLTNRPAGGRHVDCRWPEQRLTIELDSYRFHNSRHAWEQDRRREREARARGDDFRRYTWADVFETPHQVLAELGVVLPARG